jgi:hypothetical protein
MQGKRKFAEPDHLRPLAILYGGFLVSVITKVSALAARGYVDRPPLVSTMPVNASMAALVAFKGLFVLTVLLICGSTKVCLAIIKAIPIAMIAFSRRVREAQNETMHQGSAMSASGIVSLRMSIPLRRPQFRDNSLVIIGINNCDVSPRERNQLDRRIRRLLDIGLPDPAPRSSSNLLVMLYGVILALKVTKLFLLAVNSHAGRPLLAVLVPINANVATSVVFALFIMPILHGVILVRQEHDASA